MDEGNDCHEPPPSKRAQVSEHGALIQRSVSAIAALSARLEELDSNRREALCEIDEYFTKLRAGLDDLESSVRRELENAFREEDDRLQDAIVSVREQLGKKEDEEVEKVPDTWTQESMEAVETADARLLVRQTYALEHKDLQSFSDLCSLKVRHEIAPESIQLKPPRALAINGVRMSLSFESTSPKEREALESHGIDEPFSYKVAFSEKGTGVWTEREYGDKESAFCLGGFFPEAESAYDIKVRTVLNEKESEWSEAALLAVPPLSESCVWRKCPREADRWKRYAVDKSNPRVATKVCAHGYDISSIILGSVSLPRGKVSSWGVKLLSSNGGGGAGTFIGVAPSDIDQSSYGNQGSCGWYLCCYNSTLYSGPPHNYTWKAYGPRKGKSGEYMREGDTVGVVMDTTVGNLSFTFEGVDLGVAYEGIPLDKPLVPCVVLKYEGDSVELVEIGAAAPPEKGESAKKDECTIS